MFKTTLTIFLGLSLVFSEHVFSENTALRDPTQPLGFKSAKKTDPGVNLQAIYYRDNRREAIINDRLIREGETFGKYRLKKVTADEIHYLADGKVFKKKLRPSIFTKK